MWGYGEHWFIKGVKKGQCVFKKYRSVNGSQLKQL